MSTKGRGQSGFTWNRGYNNWEAIFGVAYYPPVPKGVHRGTYNTTTGCCGVFASDGHLASQVGKIVW